jgi:molecular chaperone GrpE
MADVRKEVPEEEKTEIHGEPEEVSEDSNGKQPEESRQQTAAMQEEDAPVDTVEDLRQQLDAQNDRYLRLMAEFDNYKKRVSRDYERLVDSANERLINDFIEVRENFERAIKAGEQAEAGSSFFDGIRLIFAKFDEVLSKNGLEAFSAPGDQFDPQLHDALMKSPNETIPEDHIAEVFENGYYLKKRVLRHAKVVVSGGKPERETK